MNDGSGFILFCVCLAFTFFGGCNVGGNRREKEFHVEIVKRGHGVWVVQPDGSTVFKWKEDVK
jgi:hypothetical protein